VTAHGPGGLGGDLREPHHGLHLRAPLRRGLDAARAQPLVDAGQRRGIGIASSEPLYVVKIDVPRNQLVVGKRDELYGSSFVATGVNWISIAPPGAQVRASVRIRYRTNEAPATITPTEAGRVRVAFDEPQSAITPGQAAVFYDGDVLVGGGWIE
jgi:tRNA-specific 2-thiouridylase